MPALPELPGWVTDHAEAVAWVAAVADPAELIGVPFAQLGVFGVLLTGFGYFLRYQGKLLNSSDSRVKKLEQKVERLEKKLGEATGREWACLANVSTLRRALIEHGVPVPELLDVVVDRTHHPLRRADDRLDDAADT